jgi:DNA-binding XRE family transcriptional regulator
MFIELKDPEAFRELMKKKDVTPAGLGRVIGVDESYATKIINGKLNPGPQVALKIAKFFGLLVEDIFYVNHSMLTGTKMGDQVWNNPVGFDSLWKRFDKEDK